MFDGTDLILNKATTPTFDKVQVGDEVWSSVYGAGKVIRIQRLEKRSIHVEFKKVTHSYTVRGYGTKGSLYPELFWAKFTPPDYAYAPPRRPGYQWLYKCYDTGQFGLTQSRYHTKNDAVEAFKGTAAILHAVIETADTRGI